MGNSFFFLDFFVDLLFVNFKRTEFCKVDQISKFKKIVHAKMYPNEVFVLMVFMIQAFDLVLILQ